MRLPDPLRCADGTRVHSAAEWWSRRRPELAAIFRREVYGPVPPAGPAPPAELVRERRSGEVILRELALTWPGRAPVTVQAALPARSAGPAPVVVSLNSAGPGGVAGHPRWPLGLVAGRGYAVVTADYERFRPDDPGAPHDAGTAPAGVPAIAAWAWGLSRLVDVAVGLPEADAGRVAAGGHSRLGKAALLAAAFDDRIGLALVNQAGCGGSAPSRTSNPRAETVAHITAAFPHWFADRFATHAADPDRLPVDQHCLVALCAPRPVLFTCAAGDQWADPAGQLGVLRAASPVYELLGADDLGLDGLGVGASPPEDRLIGGRLGFRLRPGGHDLTPADWATWLDHADGWLTGPHVTAPARR